MHFLFFLWHWLTLPISLYLYAQVYYVSLPLLEMDEVNLIPNINNAISAVKDRNAEIGGYVEVNTAMLSDLSGNSESNSTGCYPRLGDILDVVDRLATYIYADGFCQLSELMCMPRFPLNEGRTQWRVIWMTDEQAT